MVFFLHLFSDCKIQINFSPLISDWETLVHRVNMYVCYVYVHVLFEMLNILILKACFSPSVFESFSIHK